MMTLYWSPRTASEAIMAVLNEAGAEYRHEKIDIGAGEHKTPEYLKLHPAGLVPALVLEDGRAMFETAAMVMLIADHFPEAGLAPVPDHPDRAPYYQWLLYLTGTIQSAYKRFYWPHRFSTDEGEAEKVRAKAVEDLISQWGIVDETLAGNDWILGQRFSAVDIYLLMLAHWFKPVEELFSPYPNIARVAEKTAQRPAVARAREMHGR